MRGVYAVLVKKLMSILLPLLKAALKCFSEQKQCHAITFNTTSEIIRSEVDIQSTLIAPLII